uniref:Multicopper oxidase domain-containing protein n=1 Tax=Chryseobacterium endophyticum TaxID=1854762 RepID=A0AAU6WKL8_9FLAO
MDLVENEDHKELQPEPRNNILKKNSANGKVSFGGKTVRYDLYVKDTIVNFTGKDRKAIAVNGKLQAPTLYFTEGDTAEIYLHNMLKENTGFHWHGVILPNEFDGVPYLTTKPVKPGETHLYRFKVSQNGTYWYHSHESLQEQIGMNGILVFRKREGNPQIKYTREIPVLLGEWTNDNPKQIARRLHMANTDWYAIKKMRYRVMGKLLSPEISEQSC